MMISYDKANELSDYEVEFGINSVKDTMYLWENKHTPDSVLKQLLKLRNEWDDMVIHEPEVDETEQDEVVDVPEGVVPEFNLDEFQKKVDKMNKDMDDLMNKMDEYKMYIKNV